MLSHSHPKTVAFFADLDALLAGKPHPDFVVAELELRILHNEDCKRHLVKAAQGRAPMPAYSAFDLNELHDGLHARLEAARLRDAAPVRRAA